jgi:hypothetical protein
MGGKSTKAPQAKQLGWDMRGYGALETQNLKDINQANYAGAQPLSDSLATQTANNAFSLSSYGNTVLGPNSDISRSAQGVQHYGDTSAGAGQDIYSMGLGLGGEVYNQGLSMGNNMYNQGLAYGADAMNQANAFIGSLGGMAGSVSQPSINLGSVQNGTTAAGGNAKDYHDEWKSVYAPAARQQLADAQNYNTAGHREYLAQQAAGNAARAFQNAQGQNTRTMASMGWQPGSGAMASMQQQAALASAAQQAAQGTAASWQAEQEGWNRVNTAMNNQAGAHLIGGANDALGVEAGVTNANTAAQAGVANANTAAQASLANGWLDSQTTLGTARMSAAANAFNAGLDARSRDYATGTAGWNNAYGTGSGALMQGYQTGSQGLMQGYNQAAGAYNNAGGLYADAGQLSIDAQRAANESATTAQGLYMTPREQYFQNAQAAIQPQMWGLTNHYNAYMGAKQIEAGNAANNAGLMGSVIGAAGTAAGGYLTGAAIVA